MTASRLFEPSTESQPQMQPPWHKVHAFFMATTCHILRELPNQLPWKDVLLDRKGISSSPAVYALLLDQRFPRLIGSTQVLYVGQTSRLGGDSDRSRLYGYRYPSGKHGRLIRSKADRLTELGHQITFRWVIVGSKDDAKEIERKLLEMHLKEHLELPPFNSKS